MDQRQPARVSVDPGGIDDRDLHPGLGEEVAHPLGLPERPGDNEDGPLLGEGGKAWAEDGEPFPGGAPLDSRQAEPGNPADSCRGRPALWRRGIIEHQIGRRQTRRFRPEIALGNDKSVGQRGEQRRPRLRLERGKQADARQIAKGALCPDIEGAQAGDTTFLVLDPDGVFAGCREDVDPPLPQRELAGVRDHLHAPVTHRQQAARGGTRRRPRRAVGRRPHRRSAAQRRRRALSLPPRPRRPVRRPRRRSGPEPRAASRAIAAHAPAPAPEDALRGRRRRNRGPGSAARPPPPLGTGPAPAGRTATTTARGRPP